MSGSADACALALWLFVLEVCHKNKDAQEEINASITWEEGEGQGRCLWWNHHGTEVLEGLQAEDRPWRGRSPQLSQAALRNSGLLS